MSSPPARTNFASPRFREVLGQYPTGVTVVTAIDGSGQACGLAVGSFTSVSLDPPLVAFMPDRSSTSWPKIRAAGSFCINVLAADQETVCRAFASKAADKFAGLGWRPATSGAPILDHVVAWIDCDLDTVHEAGDHYIVLGKVRDLDVSSPVLPLLFFRGGYGHFKPLSSAVVDADLLDQLRLVDLARPAMEAVASDLDVECNAGILVGDELVYVARAGNNRDGIATRVGRRLPFIPPVGAPFVAWAGPGAVEAWLSRLTLRSGADELAACNEMVERIRRRGYSVGLGHEEHVALWETLTRTSPNVAVTGSDEVSRVVHNLRSGYRQGEFDPDERYEVRTISAAVFGTDGRVTIQLTLYGLPDRSSSEQIETYAAGLVRAARTATEAAGGHGPG